MKRVLYWVLVLACLGGVLTGGYMTGSQLLAYRAAGQAYEELYGYISSTAAEDASETQGTSSGSERVLPAGVRVDFDGLSEVNPQVVGWIFGPDTVISYPIVQGEDNSYYLHRLFTGESNGSGCIFLDAACAGDFSGDHSIIYGHHMKNGTMFASLGEYASQDYYESHPYFQLSTPQGDWRVDVFSAYVQMWARRPGRSNWGKRKSGRSGFVRCPPGPLSNAIRLRRRGSGFLPYPHAVMSLQMPGLWFTA